MMSDPHNSKGRKEEGKGRLPEFKKKKNKKQKTKNRKFNTNTSISDDQCMPSEWAAVIQGAMIQGA